MSEKARWCCIALALIVSASGYGGAAQTPATISRIDMEGNRRVRSETMRALIHTRPGEPYSEEGLRRDLQALRNTQYFESVRLEVKDDPYGTNAKIVVFYLIERPVISQIEYRGLKSVTRPEVLDRFKDRKVGLSVGSLFDPTEIKQAEVVIRELLAEHGRQAAVVKTTYERFPSTASVRLTFTVDEGPLKSN